MGKLDVVGERYENEFYIALGLHASLGDLGAGLPPCRPRQDEGLPPMASKFHRKLQEGLKMNNDDRDRAYISLLLTAVHAFDRHYQDVAKTVCEDAGGTCKAPAPKGFQRMMAKM